MRCLKSLANVADDLILEFTIYDDSSNDGTAEKIRCLLPSATIIKGDGNHYWNGGMYEVFKIALVRCSDFYLWVNDDVVSNDNIISMMVDTYKYVSSTNVNTIIVGYTIDFETNKLSYGGLKKVKRFPNLSYTKKIDATKFFAECDTFNGNCVLIPSCVVQKIGISDPTFRHNKGDIEYGFRAKKYGCQIIMTNYSVGYCKRDHNPRLYMQDTSLSFRKKVQIMHSPKHNPPRERLFFFWQYSRLTVIILFVRPYVSLIVQHISSMRSCMTKK
ncbi:hypothetical protein AGMMS49992_21130 [Clostridia bacterium]|nr:hypothetical protein AGMMS49992_21130 [Clostridia bacterium]